MKTQKRKSYARKYSRRYVKRYSIADVMLFLAFCGVLVGITTVATLCFTHKFRNEPVGANTSLEYKAYEPIVVEERLVAPIQEIRIETVPPETTVEETTAPVHANIPYYTVNGEFLGYKLSEYLYNQLDARGIAWFYETALCQLYQESRYKANAVGYDGYDQGIAQIRVIYWDEFVKASGLSSADPYNPIDSIYIYTYLMSTNLKYTGDNVNKALSRYNVGSGKFYNDEYVSAVVRWKNTMEIKSDNV